MRALLRGAVRSRSMWLGLLMILVGAIQMAAQVYQSYLTPEMQGFITSVVGGLIMILRAETTKALADKAPQ